MYEGIEIIPDISLCDIIIVKIKEECVCVCCLRVCEFAFYMSLFSEPFFDMLATILQNKIMSTKKRVCFMKYQE